MKNYIMALVMVIVGSTSVFAQRPTTSAAPSFDNSLGKAITLMSTEDNGHWNRIDTAGNVTDIRLKHPVIMGAAGMGKDGMNFRLSAGYQFRHFTTYADFGMTGIEIEGVKANSLNIGVSAMWNVMSTINPKSNFVLNLGGGIAFNSVSFDKVFTIGDKSEYDVNYHYKGHAFGPVLRGQIGYRVAKNFTLMADISWSSFDVQVQGPANQPKLADVKYNTPTVSIGLQWNIGRLYKGIGK